MLFPIWLTLQLHNPLFQCQMIIADDLTSLSRLLRANRNRFRLRATAFQLICIRLKSLRFNNSIM